MVAWVSLVSDAALADGAVIGLHHAGQELALYRVDGVVYATNNVCSHAFALLSDGWLDGYEIECPLHAGRFDIRSGKAQGNPVTCDITCYPVRIIGGMIEVEL